MEGKVRKRENYGVFKKKKTEPTKCLYNPFLLHFKAFKSYSAGVYGFLFNKKFEINLKNDSWLNLKRLYK